MPGMVTDDQLAQAERARGTGFDRLLLDHLRAHLDQCVRLARSERDAGADPRVRQLADQIGRRSVADRAELDRLNVR